MKLRLKYNLFIGPLLVLIVIVLGLALFKPDEAEVKKPPHLRVQLFLMPYTKGLKELESDFEAKTGMTVDITVVGTTVYENRIVLSFLGKTGDLDVVHAPSVHLQRWVKAGWLMPITDKVNALDDKSDFFKGPLDTFLVNDEYWGMPFFAETGMMTYRKDILSKAGYPSGPATWDDVLKIGEKLKKGKVAPFAMRGAAGQGDNMFVFPMIMRAYGGKFFADYPKDLTVAINSPQNLQALEVYSRLMNAYGPKGVGNFKVEELTAAMQGGQVAMVVDSTAIAARTLDPKESQFANKMGIAAVPRGPEGRFPALAVHGFAIPSDARNPEASFAFIKWATSPDVMRKIALSNAYPDITRASVTRDPKIIAKYKSIHPDFMRLRDAALKETIAHYRPLLSEWPEIGAAVGDYINAAINGVMSNKTALKDSERDMKDIMTDD